MRIICLCTAIAIGIGNTPCSAQESLLGSTNKESTWRFESHDGGQGKMEIAEDAAVFTVTEITGTDWHVQAAIPNLELKEGTAYTLSFEIKVSGRQLVKVNAMVDEEDWHQIGLYEEFTPTSEFKEYEFTFRATDVAAGNKNRVTFVFGDSKGTVTVRNVSLVAETD